MPFCKTLKLESQKCRDMPVAYIGLECGNKWGFNRFLECVCHGAIEKGRKKENGR